MQKYAIVTHSSAPPERQENVRNLIKTFKIPEDSIVSMGHTLEVTKKIMQQSVDVDRSLFASGILDIGIGDGVFASEHRYLSSYSCTLNHMSCIIRAIQEYDGTGSPHLVVFEDDVVFLDDVTDETILNIILDMEFATQNSQWTVLMLGGLSDVDDMGNAKDLVLLETRHPNIACVKKGLFGSHAYILNLDSPVLMEFINSFYPSPPPRYYWDRILSYFWSKNECFLHLPRLFAQNPIFGSLIMGDNEAYIEKHYKRILCEKQSFKITEENYVGDLPYKFQRDTSGLY